MDYACERLRSDDTWGKVAWGTSQIRFSLLGHLEIREAGAVGGPEGPCVKYPAMPSESYQLLKRAQREKLYVKATYEEKFRIFMVIQLGWTNKDERCFARQEGGESSHTLPGLRCFVVDKLHKVELGDPIPVPRQALSAEEQQRTDCVTAVDEPCT